MLWLSKGTRFLVGLVVDSTIGLALCLVFNSRLLYGMQLRSNDFLFRAANLYQGAETAEKIVVVGIDDTNLEQLGRFSLWPRSHYAQLINILTGAKARVIFIVI